MIKEVELLVLMICLTGLQTDHQNQRTFFLQDEDITILLVFPLPNLILNTAERIISNNIDSTKFVRQKARGVENLHSNTSDSAEFELSFTDFEDFFCTAWKEMFNFFYVDKSEKQKCAKFNNFSGTKLLTNKKKSETKHPQVRKIVENCFIHSKQRNRMCN